MSDMAEQHSLAAQRTGAARTGAVLAVVVIFALFDRWAADPLALITYNVSNSLLWPFSTLLVILPQALAAALVGWLVGHWLSERPQVVVAIAAFIFLYYLLAHWEHTVAVFRAVMPVDLAAESLVVPVGFLVAYGLARRQVPATLAVMPLWRLALWLVLVVVAEVFFLRFVDGLLLATIGALPIVLAPLWLGLAQFLVYLAAGYALGRRRLLPLAGAIVFIVFACLVHAGLWVWPAQYAEVGLAIALVWIPLLLMPIGFAVGWGLARRCCCRGRARR